TIIGQNATVSGNLKSTANILVYGQTDGNVFSDKNIIINPHGVAKGKIECAEFELAGTLEGKIRAKKVNITSNGKLLGDVIANTIKIDEGADFIGCSKKIDQSKNSKLKNTDPVYEI
ncbi:polymer-forming cytoskeletal protein, partial [Patescibacteria group bacterium]|nr:polymer-forming cytoskeletal protein [Patescibacteria group bacterium]